MEASMQVAEARPKKKRMLGWDTWRFWGAFTIFWGHNLFALTAADPNLFPEMQPTSLLELIFNPANSWAVVYAAVPVFVFLSGYFSLRKEPGDNDWASAWNHFVKYILYVVKWSIIGLVLLLAFPQIWPGFSAFSADTVPGMLWELWDGIVNCTISVPFMVTTFNVNYFVLGLAWMMLFSPLFRYFVHTVPVKALRVFTAIISLYLLVFPLVRTIGSAWLFNDPESLMATFLAGFEPFTTQQFTWDCFWIAYFLWGGLFVVDTQMQAAVKRISWPAITLAGIVAFLLTCAQVWLILYNSDLSYAGLGYNMGSGILITCVYIVIAFKLNDVVVPESLVGRFVSTFSGDLLGVMTIGLMFGTQVMNTSLTPFMAQVANAIWVPAVPFATTALWFLFNVAYWAVLLTAVHFVHKIPVVGAFLFDFPKVKMRDWADRPETTSGATPAVNA